MKKKKITGKHKRSSDEWTIELVQNPDILATLGAKKRDNQLICGFALEAKNGRENAQEKFKKKNCDVIVLNSPSAIDATKSAVEIYTEKNGWKKISNSDKAIIATEIIKSIERLWR